MAREEEEGAIVPCKLRFVPRIKLEIEISGLPKSSLCSDSTVENCLLLMSEGRLFDYVDTNLCREDIHFKLMCHNERFLPPDKVIVKGRGTLFFRHLSRFADNLNELQHIYEQDDQVHDKLRKLREHMKNKLSKAKIHASGNPILNYVRAISAAGEDADQMISLAQSHGSSSPAFVLHGFPCKWFAHPSDPSLPSKEALHGLLEPLAPIWKLDVTLNEADSEYFDVTLQYSKSEECYKALKHLCSFSLQRVGEGGSAEHADFQVTWKDSFPSGSQPEIESSRSVAQTEWHLNTRLPPDYSVSPAKMNEYISEVQSLRAQMALLQERLEKLEGGGREKAEENK